jgi:hypothetical protein
VTLEVRLPTYNFDSISELPFDWKRPERGLVISGELIVRQPSPRLRRIIRIEKGKNKTPLGHVIWAA